MILKWLIFVFASGALVNHIFPFVNVCGDSMYPTYKDDEIIWSTRLFRRNKLKIGDVVVFKHPYVKGRLLIKRLADIYYEDGKAKSFYFLGDNSSNSQDSRNFGYVLREDLVSKVLFSRERR